MTSTSSNAVLTTRTNLVLSVRPAGPGDESLLADLYKHVSAEDLRFRFLGGMREVSHERIVAMTNVDHRTVENFLAFTKPDNILVASAMLSSSGGPERGEVAIAVRSDYRHKGIAWELLRHVAGQAKKMGFKSIESIESREHHEAIELEREQGFHAVPYPEDPRLVLIRKELDAVPRSAA
ncbi:GNAT family N-acetyltransferase [Tianweitania sediminis]|uniref:GNAT family N-acetyltransferase n=1 Tax=Tianweitania sediminis TaxID=1502156 RepID=A0A8J7R808_9HYPH|nr:GNAT family N-acetyltransferase [Tianweitania sediminis]MBP0439872.1 GNAT family N-acetyltransferase [Tianweitania sediminis]